jgi:hypothetical protein
LKLSLKASVSAEPFNKGALFEYEKYVIHYYIQEFSIEEDLASFSHEDILVQGTDVEMYFSFN